MEQKVKNVLQRIYNEAIKTSDGYVFIDDIGVYCEERKQICRWLVENGYISKYEAFGKKGIQCQTLSKTFDYFSRNQ